MAKMETIMLGLVLVAIVKGRCGGEEAGTKWG